MGNTNFSEAFWRGWDQLDSIPVGEPFEPQGDSIFLLTVIPIILSLLL